MKKQFLYFAYLFTAVCGMVSCQDDELVEPLQPSDGSEGVSVEVVFDTEEVGDACDYLSPQGTSRSVAVCNGASHRDVSHNAASHNGAIKVELLPTSVSRATDLNTDKPTQLTNVNIVQRKKDKTLVSVLSNGTVSLGAKQTLSGLNIDDDSDLFIFARNGTSGNDLTTGNLSTCAVTSTEINKITEATGIEKMPYFLHLEHVKIIKDAAGNYVIQSNEGHDARLRLRRLASRVNVTWKFEVKDYTLQEVTLQDTPLKYLAFPSETESTYPDLMDQYYTVKLYDANNSGTTTTSASCWVARNVRGTAKVATEAMRDKERAPQGSSFLNFVAIKNGAKDRLIYRIYLGGNSIQDFNVQDNTNYNYNLTFSSSEQIADADGRVQLLNGSPASKGNTTFVPTANCFMVKPGGSFHFDPFLYRQAGKDIANTVLKGWAGKRGGLCSVKVFWQTRENGDTGDPVLGIANNSVTDHTNIVELTNADNTSLTSVSATAFTEENKCHIHCRVAPNTIGGNGLIAAYDASGVILWSWHLWVTDYNPDPHGNYSVLDDVNKRKQKYTHRTDKDYLPMMDRNLGANKGYDYVPTKELDRSRASGLHYQWGRKDPFPGSFSKNAKGGVSIISGVITDNLLNVYGPDGYTFISRLTQNSSVSVENSAKRPDISYFSQPWCNEAKTYLWSTVDNLKTFYDPSPSGWQVPDQSVFTNYLKSGTTGSLANLNFTTNDRNQIDRDGGALIKYDGNDGSKVTYYRLSGYPRYSNWYEGMGQIGSIWSRNISGNSAYIFVVDISSGYYGIPAYQQRDAHQIRCIQELP
ncbi:DUF4906 domain-containing protein [Phocaeicola sp.]